MAGKNNTKIRMRKNWLPKAKTIARKGLYEMMWKRGKK